MNLQCVLYLLVKIRSLCRPSFECSKRSKSTYFTQFTNIAYIQKLIPPHSRGMSPHIYIFYESALLFPHAGKNQKSVSFEPRSLLECSNGSKSTYSTQLTKIVQLQRLIAPNQWGYHRHKCCLNEAPMLLLWCNPSSKSVGHCIIELQALKVTLF